MRARALFGRLGVRSRGRQPPRRHNRRRRLPRIAQRPRRRLHPRPKTLPPRRPPSRTRPSLTPSFIARFLGHASGNLPKLGSGFVQVSRQRSSGMFCALKSIGEMLLLSIGNNVTIKEELVQ